MRLVVVTPPAAQPVSLAEAKLHCRVDIDDDDTLLNGYIAAATEYVEKQTQRALVTQTLRLSLDDFPRESSGSEPVIRLPRPKLQSITSIQYYDTLNALQTLASTEYQLDDQVDPAELWPKVDGDWPLVKAGRINAVQVTYVAGYGVAAAVPELLKQAIKMLVAHWYENRESQVTGTIASDIRHAVDQVCGMFWHGWSFAEG